MPSPTTHGPFFNGFLEINGIELSNDLESFSVTQSAVSLPNKAHGDETETMRPGLFQWSIAGRAYTDFGAGKFHAVCEPLFRGRLPFTVRAKANADDAASATNPQWSGSGYFTQLTELQGTHGDNLMTDFNIVANSDLTVEEM